MWSSLLITRKDDNRGSVWVYTTSRSRRIHEELKIREKLLLDCGNRQELPLARLLSDPTLLGA